MDAKKCKSFRLQGGFALWPPDQGLCPWTPLGAPPPDPRYRLALPRSPCISPVPLFITFRRLWISMIGLLSESRALAPFNESHRISDQLDRPDHPNSRTISTTASGELFPTESAGVWLSSDRVAVELIGYWSVQKCYPDHTISLHDHLPINSTSTRPIPDHFPFPIASWAIGLSLPDFLTIKNNRVGSPIDADHPYQWPLARTASDRLIELIWSALGTHPNVRRSIQ